MHPRDVCNAEVYPIALLVFGLRGSRPSAGKTGRDKDITRRELLTAMFNHVQQKSRANIRPALLGLEHLKKPSPEPGN
jgi:hypothetical protein